MKTRFKFIFNIFTLSALLMSLIGSAVIFIPAHAATITVTDCAKDNGGPGQLRTLMNAAVSGDTINIPACIITIEGAAGEDLNASGDLDFTKNLTIAGAGAGNSIIDGGAIDRVFHITGAYTVSISGVTIRNGNAFTLSGGGIENFGGTLTVINSTFGANSAKFGGGIDNLGTLTMTNSTFNGNTADPIAGGGGIFNNGALRATNSTFSGNSGGSGGGILSFGALTMTNSTVSGNISGKGIYSTGATTLKNTIIANNVGGNCLNSGALTVTVDSMADDASCDSATVKLLTEINLGTLTGSPAYFPLNTGSAAIDTGTNTGCPADSQNGVTRPQNGICDIGSYETGVAQPPSGPIFADVPFTHWANPWVERLYKAHVTDGCGNSPMIYCPDDTATRAQMAIFILRSKHNTFNFSYMPPPAIGTVFTDVPLGSFAGAWIEELALEDITTGCGGGNYCPDASITRAEMAVFLLRGKHGSDYIPPAATGAVFSDVPLGSFADAWIEQLANEGITRGCGSGNYCPDSPVTRAEMAVFLVKAFGLP